MRNVERNRSARYIIDDFENNDDIFTRSSDSSVPRNARQIYNLKANSNHANTVFDDVSSILTEMLNQAKNATFCNSPLDES